MLLFKRKTKINIAKETAGKDNFIHIKALLWMTKALLMRFIAILLKDSMDPAPIVSDLAIIPSNGCLLVFVK